MYFRKRYGGILGLIMAIYLFGFTPDKSFMNCENSMCSITTKSAIGKILSKRTFDISVVKSFYLDRYHTSHHRGYKYYVYAQTHNGQKFRVFKNSTRSSSYAENKIQSLNWAIQNPPVNINIKY